MNKKAARICFFFTIFDLSKAFDVQLIVFAEKSKISIFDIEDKNRYVSGFNEMHEKENVLMKISETRTTLYGIWTIWVIMLKIRETA